MEIRRPVGAELFHAGGWADRRTKDRHNETHTSFSQFYEHALQKPCHYWPDNANSPSR